jgi:hypothetical protein
MAGAGSQFVAKSIHGVAVALMTHINYRPNTEGQPRQHEDYSNSNTDGRGWPKGRASTAQPHKEGNKSHEEDCTQGVAEYFFEELHDFVYFSAITVGF